MGWQSVWDEEAKDYYYWNTETQETTWTKPAELEKKKKDDGEKKVEEKKPETTESSSDQKAMQDYFASKEYKEWYMNYVAEQQIQQSAAQVAAEYAQSQKGNRFADLATAPSLGDSSTNYVSNREYKQMSYYFDVDKYQQERALDRLKPKVQKKLSRKEIEKFKQKKHEKKVASLLQRMGPDA